MKKNVILRLCLLMAVALSLSSCVRDEILSSGKNSKPSTENLTAAKFGSKSFWKEDEKYISKVQQVFLKHANMQHVQERYGELYWDYAMTFGQFNETYLIVPVIKNNKVVTLMEAIRIKDKLHLYEKEDKELMDFFYHVIYSRIISTGENISSNKNPLAKGVTYVCTTRTLEVGCFDGEPNCEPMFTTTTVCKWTTLPQKSFDPIGLDGGGGGGNGGDNNTYDYPDPPPQTPCEKIAEIGKNLNTNNIFENLKIKNTSTNEFGYVLSENNGTINEFPIEGADGEASINFSVNGQIDGFIHFHYTGLLSVFSVSDMFALAQLHKNGNIKDTGSFVIGVVTASNTQYMMVIDDPIKFANFADNLFTGNEIDDIALNIYEKIYKDLYKITPTNTVSINENAFVGYLQTADTGLKILKGDSTFNNWNVLTKNSDGTVTSQNCP